jgi:hypothetical protein
MLALVLRPRTEGHRTGALVIRPRRSRLPRSLSNRSCACLTSTSAGLTRADRHAADLHAADLTRADPGEG